MSIKKGSFAVGLLCYVLWGILPIYWNLLADVNPFLILCCRIVFAFVFMICTLLVTGRMQVFRDTLKDRDAMRFLIPASVMITMNWGIYIWAVNSGHILDSSLGYYLNPLVVFLIGIVLFKEKSTKLQLAAVALAFTGVMISVIAYGKFPVISISLSLTFATYGALKKKAHADPVASIAVESMIITPLAIAFALFFMSDSIRAVGTADILLLVGGGAVTAVPLVMYSSAVNDIPFIIVGFFQYISPSLALVYGLMRGEHLSASQVVSFLFIWLGLIVFSVALFRKNTVSTTT